MTNDEKIRLFWKFDFIVFSILAVISEVLAQYLTYNNNVTIYFSFALFLSVSLLVRWKISGIIPYMLSNLVVIIFVYNYVSGNIEFWRILVYYLGSAIFMIGCVIFDRLFRNKIEHIYFVTLMFLVAFLLISIGRITLGLITKFGGDTFIENLNFLLTEIMLTFVMSLVLMAIAISRKSFLIFMPDYFKGATKIEIEQD